MTQILMIILAGVAGGGDGKVSLHLKGGARIDGTVLKENEDAVFVDLGFTVLAVPAKEILRREAPEDAAPAATPAAAADADYTTGSGLGERSVRELAEILGTSVVMVSTPSGTGSGFFINRRGEVITNHHVIEGERKISLTVFEKRPGGFEKKKVQKVRILAMNPFYDLALLRIEDEDLAGLNFTVAALGDDEALKVGESTFAIGNPRGLERTLTEGIISTGARAMEGQLYLQTTTQINPGNSGGPLFNLRGEVVGVTNMILLQSEGLGFAIPTRRVREFLDHREAFAFDADHANTGHRYLPPAPPPAPAK